MTDNNSKQKPWSVTLTPHRSLTQQGFVALMAMIIGINLVGALAFVAAGAWPILGFLGLDVALIWWALRQNIADGKCVERISIAGDTVYLQRLSASGEKFETTFNRHWLRVTLEWDASRELVGRLLLFYRGKSTEIASFLGAEERKSLAAHLKAALAQSTI